jgi:hypothetical protein
VKLTLSAAVGVDGPYQDQLGRRVRDVAQYVENIESHGGLLHRIDGDTARGLSPVTGAPNLGRKTRGGREGGWRWREGLPDGVR